MLAVQPKKFFEISRYKLRIELAAILEAMLLFYKLVSVDYITTHLNTTHKSPLINIFKQLNVTVTDVQLQLLDLASAQITTESIRIPRKQFQKDNEIKIPSGMEHTIRIEHKTVLVPKYNQYDKVRRSLSMSDIGGYL